MLMQLNTAAEASRGVAMKELIRTNDIVVLSLVRAVLENAGIFLLVADEAMSSMEGSIGILPRRVLVPDEDEARSRRLVIDAGLDEAMLARVGS